MEKYLEYEPQKEKDTGTRFRAEETIQDAEIMPAGNVGERFMRSSLINLFLLCTGKDGICIDGNVMGTGNYEPGRQ